MLELNCNWISHYTNTTSKYQWGKGGGWSHRQQHRRRLNLYFHVFYEFPKKPHNCKQIFYKHKKTLTNHITEKSDKTHPQKTRPEHTQHFPRVQPVVAPISTKHNCFKHRKTIATPQAMRSEKGGGGGGRVIRKKTQQTRQSKSITEPPNKKLSMIVLCLLKA
jgi:hypothetical protein